MIFNTKYIIVNSTDISSVNLQTHKSSFWESWQVQLNTPAIIFNFTSFIVAIDAV